MCRPIILAAKLTRAAPDLCLQFHHRGLPRFHLLSDSNSTPGDNTTQKILADTLIIHKRGCELNSGRLGIFTFNRTIHEKFKAACSATHTHTSVEYKWSIQPSHLRCTAWRVAIYKLSPSLQVTQRINKELSEFSWKLTPGRPFERNSNKRDGNVSTVQSCDWSRLVSAHVWRFASAGPRSFHKVLVSDRVTAGKSLHWL